LLYTRSAGRELGLDTSWRHAFEVLRSPSIPSILALGFLLLMIFLGWLATARGLYEWLLGPVPPKCYWRFVTQVFTTSNGWILIILGNAIGVAFSIVVFSVSVVSLPLLLDRDFGAAVATHTSIRAALANPLIMALWALIVAGLLILGSLLVLVGLAVVLPVLGHATWHLYRGVVEPTNCEAKGVDASK
jgi:uncharacterized membrane protein